MGVLSGLNAGNLIAIDTGGLLDALQQISNALREQQSLVDTQQDELEIQKDTS